MKELLNHIPGLFFILLVSGSLQAQEKTLEKGMVINSSTKIKKAVYKLDGDENLTQPVLLIEGNDITIDFNNATLNGSNSKAKPDQYFGLAVFIRNSKNITLKNLNAKGYKVALMAKNVESLTLVNCDFSYNYRQHLNSTQEKEDISDWMSYHHNEKDEWLRYGAAMYLRNCQSATIKNCKVTGGQNALMMMECNGGRILNNDFSFNSGIGIGMYKSSRNKVMGNRIIFNVRGYSHGVYNRGQDSAGILVYEQSSNNIFYKNDVTHSGDGFFLWAGQTTMDNGQGGCNDNLIVDNDFSYAPTNGIEVTFSRNTIFHNRMVECDHGIWGGYSYETVIRRNTFQDNRIGIAIEHGNENKILENSFFGDKEAIRLWGNKEEPSDWGYPKFRDTRSRDYLIVANQFRKNSLAFNLRQTDHLKIFNNNFSDCDQVYKIDSTITNLDTAVNEKTVKYLLADTLNAYPIIDQSEIPLHFIPSLAGRKNILITEWGPYDFRSPIIWNTNPTDTSDIMKFDLLGPKGKWKIISAKGVENISALNGEFPSSITAKKVKSGRTDILIELEYIGSVITTPFGQNIMAGKPYSFYFKKFFQPVEWNVRWFAMDTSLYNPVRTGQLFAPNVRVKPVKSELNNKLDYAWWGGIKGDDEEQYTQFITVAEGQANFLPGMYELGITWDDAVRVYVDDKLVVNEWNPSKYIFDESPHTTIRLKLSGNHRFRVEHLELGGFATLSLKIKPAQ
jgi:parallel beta-helix repeat protein